MRYPRLCGTAFTCADCDALLAIKSDGLARAIGAGVHGQGQRMAAQPA
jgi:hypothetical protein